MYVSYSAPSLRRITPHKDTMEKKETVARDDARVYEIGYLVVSSVPEEKVAAEVDAIKSVITKNGGEFIGEEFPKLRPLAYMMRKEVGSVKSRYNDAYFGWVKFDIDPSMLKDIKAALDTQQTILRYLLVNTVRENTYLGQKAFAKTKEEGGVEKTESTPVEGVVAPVVAEEIDKTIDDMVKEA